MAVVLAAPGVLWPSEAGKKEVEKLARKQTSREAAGH